MKQTEPPKHAGILLFTIGTSNILYLCSFRFKKLHYPGSYGVIFMQACTISWTYDPSDLAPPDFQSFPLSLKPFCSPKQFLLHFHAFVYIALWIYSFMFYFCVLRPTRYVLKCLTQNIKGTHLWATQWYFDTHL